MTNYFGWYINKYYKRGKEKQLKKPYMVNKYVGILNIYNFDLYEYVKQRYSILKGNVHLVYCCEAKGDKDFMELDGCMNSLLINNRGAISVSDYEQIFEADALQEGLINGEYFNGYIELSDEYFELVNLLSLFRFLGIEKGITTIWEMIKNELQFYARKAFDTTELLEYLKKDYYYNTMVEEKRLLISHPVIYQKNRLNRNGKWVFEDLSIRYCEFTDFTAYYQSFAEENKDKIDSEILKIENLLDAL